MGLGEGGAGEMKRERESDEEGGGERGTKRGKEKERWGERWGERQAGSRGRRSPSWGAGMCSLRALPLSPVMWGGFISPGAAASVTDLIKLFSIKKLPRHSSTLASRAPAGIKC